MVKKKIQVSDQMSSFSVQKAPKMHYHSHHSLSRMCLFKCWNPSFKNPASESNSTYVTRAKVTVTMGNGSSQHKSLGKFTAISGARYLPTESSSRACKNQRVPAAGRRILPFSTMGQDGPRMSPPPSHSQAKPRPLL